MKTVICYTSVTGFTHTYADWLGESLGVAPIEAKDISKSMLVDADSVVYAGPVHAGRIKGYQRMRRKTPKQVPIITIAVGAAKETEDNSNDLKEKNFSGDTAETFFYLRGGMNYGELKGFMKWMMNTFRKFTAKKPESELTPDEKEMLASFDHPVDYTDRELLRPVLEYISELSPEN